MQSPEIQITNPDNMPLGELLQPQIDGAPVQRSAHVGNQFGADLILSSLGCRMIMVDVNYGDRDKLYFPQLQVDEDTQPEIIACSKTLSSHNQTFNGQPLSEFHNGALEKAFGNQQVQSEDEYAAANFDTYEEALGLFVKTNPELFKRCVNPSGQPVPFQNFGNLTLEQLSMFNNADGSGVVIPNEINIVTNFVSEALNFDVDSIIHISGPTMFNYMREMRPVCNQLYGVLRDKASFGNCLPRQLNVRLVPAAGVRFVVRQSLESELDDLLTAVDELEALDRDVTVLCKQIQSSDLTRPQKNEAFKTARQPIAAQQAMVLDLFQPVTSMFFVKDGVSNMPTFTSQYSALREGANGTPGSGLYIPKFVLEQPIAEVSQRFARVEKVYNKGRRA